MRGGLLDHPADLNESDDLLAAALRKVRLDLLGAQLVAELSGVVAAVRQDHLGSPARATDPPGYGRDHFDQSPSGLGVRHVAARW
jgi:hypothetical protein